jgi:hypothetical protein
VTASLLQHLVFIKRHFLMMAADCFSLTDHAMVSDCHQWIHVLLFFNNPA